MPSDCRLCFKQAPPSLIIKDACSGGSLMNKSLGRDYDWSAANKQAAIGCYRNRRRGRPAESGRRHVVTAERARRRAVDRVFMCALLSQNTIFLLSPCGASLWMEQRSPASLCNCWRWYFLRGRFGPATEVLDAQGENRETFQTNFFFPFLHNLVFWNWLHILWICFSGYSNIGRSEIIRLLFIRLQPYGCNS